MANKKVSQLTSKPSVLVTDLFPIADPTTGQLFKTTISALGTAIGSGVSSVNTLVGVVVLDTDDIQELVSPTNKWYTDTRSRAAISGGTGISYNSGTGVITNAVTSGQIATALGYTPADDALVVKLAGSQTITGTKTFQQAPLMDIGVGFKDGNGVYNTIQSIVTGWQMPVNGNNHNLIFSTSTNYTYTFPNASGTIALTSNLSAYLPLAGGTLTGALIGTSASFPNGVTINGVGADLGLYRANDSNGASISFGTDSIIKWNVGLRNGGAENFYIYNFNTSANSVIINNTTNEVTLAGTLNASGIKIDGDSVPYIMSTLAGNDLNIQFPVGQKLSINDNGATNVAYFGKTEHRLLINGSIALTVNSGGTILNNALVGTTANFTGALSGTSATFSSTVQTPFLAVTQSGSQIASFESTNANGGYMTWGTSGTTIADIGTLQQIFGSGGSTNFGINARGAKDLAFGTNNTERLRITSSGNVGIGTTAPDRKLTVQGADDGTLQIRMQGTAQTTSYAEIGRESASTGDFRINVCRTGTVINALKIADTTGAATFSASVTANGLTLLNSGGTYANWYVSSFLIGRIGNVDTNDMYYDSTFGGNHYFRTGTGGTTSPSNKMVITTSGNVGIGTTAPLQTSANRTVTTINGTTSAILNLATSDTLRAYLYADSSGSTFETAGTNTISASGANVIAFNTNGSERMRITSGGITRALRFQVGAAGIAAGNYCEVGNDDNVGYIDTIRAVNNGDFHFRFDGTSRANINRTTGIYTATSDSRLKTNILDSKNVLSVIDKIKVRSYNWIENNSYEPYGLIAQELHEILPEYVYKPKTEGESWGLSKAELVPMLVKAVQELKAELDTLKNK